MKYIPILFVALFIFTHACKKDKDQEKVVDFNGTYISDFSVSHDPAVLYTNKGKITDTNIVKSFIQKYGISGSLTFLQGYENLLVAEKLDSMIAKYKLTIEGDSIQFATLKVSNDSIITDQYKAHLKRVSGSSILMIKNNPSNVPSGDEGNFSCSNALRKFRSNSPAYNCVNGYCSGFEQIPLTMKDGYISYPIFIYFFRKKIDHIEGLNACISYSNGIYDVFNESAVKNFLPGDTLLLMNYSRHLYKQ